MRVFDELLCSGDHDWVKSHLFIITLEMWNWLVDRLGPAPHHLKVLYDVLIFNDQPETGDHVLNATSLTCIAQQLMHGAWEVRKPHLFMDVHF